MATQQSQHLGITLPITMEFWQIAQHFAQQCPLQGKAEQIRHNTLAVCAVNSYLQLMSVPTDLAASDSWNPMMQMMANVADLNVPNLGVLACRPLLPDSDTCYIPAEAWHDRAGYVAVIIDEAANEATLVGFTPEVGARSHVALENFMAIETLLDQAHSVQATFSCSSASASDHAMATYTQLKDWVTSSIDAAAAQANMARQNIARAGGWQAVEALLNPADMSFAFRTAAGLNERAAAANVSRARLLDLGLQLGQALRVALVMHLTQQENNHTDILLQVRPLGDSPYLPEGLVLTVLDDQGNHFRSATSRDIDNYVQIQISGQSEEIFGVRVSMEDATFEEQFVI
ncbi:MAG: DUF1822 family protein [Phormidesmis sp. RL_2_1]|nr:DUF1822 family protein [Phormidesmis sp. RL_2_1]